MEQICWRCVADEELVRRIKATGLVDVCACCGGARRLTIAAEDLATLLRPLALLYTSAVEFMPMEYLKDGPHPTLAEVFVDEWQLFDDLETAICVLDACMEPCHPKHNPDQSPLDPERTAYEEETWWTGDYERVAALRKRWADVKAALLHTNRYFPGAGIDEISAALWVAESTMLKGTPLFRARLGSEEDGFTRAKMGAPPASKATGGRANPVGMPYLYLGSDEGTAVAEVRPHRGDKVMIAEFKLRQDLPVVDLRRPTIGSPFAWGDRLHEVLRTMPFLADLGREMSRPVSSQRRELEYVPTQYLCELIKSKGYRGVAYASGLSEGWNLALFDSSLAKSRRPVERAVGRVSITLK